MATGNDLEIEFAPKVAHAFPMVKGRLVFAAEVTGNPFPIEGNGSACVGVVIGDGAIRRMDMGRSQECIHEEVTRCRARRQNPFMFRFAS